MTITYLEVKYDDEKDTMRVRVVQAQNYGDTDADLSNGERNQLKSLIKRLTGVWKGKAPRTLMVNFAPNSLPPAVPVMSQWTWDHVVQPVKKLFGLGTPSATRPTGGKK